MEWIDEENLNRRQTEARAPHMKRRIFLWAAEGPFLLAVSKPGNGHMKSISRPNGDSKYLQSPRHQQNSRLAQEKGQALHEDSTHNNPKLKKPQN
jgi:hypothetical protein